MTSTKTHIHMDRRGLRLEGLRARLAQRNVAYFYGLFAVLAIASVQIFFSVRKGGFFPEQWHWGAAVILATLIGAAFVPGYFSSAAVGRKQWALAGTLLVLTSVVTASISWSISPDLSSDDALRTLMYTAAFILVLPVAARWGSLVVDAVLFGGILPTVLYGLLQKIVPMPWLYTGFETFETDPKASSTVGYHPAFGMMCAMGALLIVSRIGAFRSLPLRALYSAVGFLFLMGLYFSFSRGALLALAVGVVVLFLFIEHRFEALANLAVMALPALWVISQVRDLPGLVTRPANFDAMAMGGFALPGLLLKGALLAVVAQVLLSILTRALIKLVPENVRFGAKLAAAVLATGIVVGGLFLGLVGLQNAGGFSGLKSRITANDSLVEKSALGYDETHRLTALSAYSRIVLWKIALENWREYPLTGTGGDTYRLVYSEKPPSERIGGPVLHPHSIWMSLLSDTGIFAFLAFAAFCAGGLALTCYNLFSKTRSSRSRALLAGSAAALTTYLVSSSIDWNWYICATTLPFFTLAAVAVGMRADAVSAYPPNLRSVIRRARARRRRDLTLR